MNNRYEFEIDLIDLLHHLLRKWRSVLVCMFIGMMLFGVYGYFRKVSVTLDEAIQEVEEKELPFDENGLPYLGAKISGFQKDEAILAVESYLNYEKIYEERKNAGEKSIILQLDSLSVPGCVTNYKISDYSNDNVPEGSSVTNVDNIVRLYRDALFDKSVIEDIRKANSWDYEDGFIRELLRVDKNGLDIMTVTVNAPTKKECEVIVEVMDKKIASVTPDIQEQYYHNIDNAQSTYNETVKSDIFDKKKSQKDDLLSIEKTMQTVSSAMFAEQKNYYTRLLFEVKACMAAGEENVDVRAVAEHAMLEEGAIFEALAATDQMQDQTIQEPLSEENTVRVASKRISPKYIVLGAIAGIFLAFCFYGALYVFSPKLRTKGDLQDVFNLSILGEIKDDSRYNRFLSVVDRFIDSAFDKTDWNLTTAERMELITSAICLGQNKTEADSVFITGNCSGKRAEELKESIIAGIYANGIKRGNFTALSGASPIISSESLKMLSSADFLVLVEETGVSRYDDIARTLELCDKFGVKILGAVVLA